MQHVRSLKAVSLDAACVTVGTFDGVHRGHAQLVRATAADAHERGVAAIVVSFHPHPAVVLGRRSGSFCLTTPDERARFLGEEGIDLVVTEPFTLELAEVSAEAFMQLLKAHLGMKSLWIGHDFALGKGREGNETFLRRLGEKMDFEVRTVEAFQSRGVISSTRIRELLWEGNVKEAGSLLGRPYHLEGLVVPGDQRGRHIGIPTANLQPDDSKLVPASGVYACSAEVDGRKYQAAVNIGIRPTFEGGAPIQHIEAHLLDFEGDLYGRSVLLQFIERLRPEKRFSSASELVAQIHTDIQETRDSVKL